MSVLDKNDSSRSVDYAYNDFHRLKTASTQGTHWGLAWTYDAAGNVLNDGQHNYGYDANNMVTTVDGGAYTYQYGGSGRRVMKVSAAETRYYVMGAGEYSSASGWVRVFVRVAGNRIEYSGGTATFHQSDHLGTPRVESDVAGAVVGSWSAYPFGEQWESSGGSGDDYRFTGHLRDGETGSEYAGARFYSAATGRWGTVDAAWGDVADPQSLKSLRLCRGRSSELRGSGRPPPPAVVAAFFRGANVAAVVVRSSTFTGRGPVTFLSAEFFQAGGTISFPVRRRAIILLHEAVHAFGGLGDGHFGGSVNLTELIVDACFPALSGTLGGID